MTRDELEWELRRTTRWLLQLLVLLLVLLVGTGAFVYWQARLMLDPDELVARGAARLKEDYPELRQRLKKQVARVAPRVAEKASNRILHTIPKGRRELEDLLAREADSGVNEGVSLTQQQFRRFLQVNRERIRQGFADLHRAPERGTALAAEMERVLDSYLGTDIAQDIRTALEVLRSLNEKLGVLLAGGKLSRSEQAELRIVRILRAMQQRGPLGNR